MAKKKKTDKTSEENILENNAGQMDDQKENGNSENLETENKSELDYEKLLTQSQDYFEGWQRERADFQNYKKRIERDQSSLKSFVTAEIIKKYIVVVDDLELAIKNRPTHEESKGWVDGINLIYQKLISILEGEGVEVIPVDGEFDPNIHEALSQIDHPEFESGKIVDVMRQGYKIGDRIIRPALVIVAR
ncbi:MAG TPA: nucleotide exchange factor GrpE [Anaerolineaceae bacterium]|nr:nucleotide exchange factor GrpE [Anaerolineaceae bacterium]